MASRQGLLFVTSAAVMFLAYGQPALAQSKSDLQSSQPQIDLGELIERMQKKDKEAADDILLLDKSKNARNQDTELSFGAVEDATERPYSLDPTYEDSNMPAFGLNLKMGF